MLPKIAKVRAVLLSAPYANDNSAEVHINLPSGYKSCSLVEVTLDNGTIGLGEGYIGVFAPHVFESIVNLIAPYLIGKEISQTNLLYKAVCNITDYWSFQGAARHVISAFEMAFVDAKAKHLNVPAYDLFGGAQVNSIPLYGSGGDSLTPESMVEEFEMLKKLGISIFKIRARNYEVNKTVWCLNKGKEYNIRIAVDMCQNLANPGQSVSEVMNYIKNVEDLTDERIYFLEESLGCQDTESYPLLRKKINIPVCGGEVVTTSYELSSRVEKQYYDFVQPDATVIGGMSEVHSVFDTCKKHGSKAVVHCWGGAVCMMSNYHVAFANGADLAEYPMPYYPLREELMVEPLKIVDGWLQVPTTVGLGVKLTPEIEQKYAFREDAVYNCGGNIRSFCDDSRYK